jgi:hypothetical protein
MKYFDAGGRPHRNTDLRLIALGVVVVLLSAVVAYLSIRDDDPAGSSSDTTAAASTTGAATTTTLVTAPPSQVPLTSPNQTVAGFDAATLVEDCVQYVPTAVYFGNFYMKAIWDLGGGTPEGLRRVCEGMVTSDPAGLQRMSDEYHALVQFVAPTTTV